MISTSPELFLNMKRVPDPSSEEYDAFFQAELEKIRYGITINGVYLHGWLYWHINHWNMYVDIEDIFRPQEILRNFQTPQFRDNEWMIQDAIIKAEEQKKGLLIFGSRRMGKTAFEASWIGRGATVFQGSENVLSSTNEADIKVLASALDKGLNAVHPYFRFQRLQDDWRKEVSLGIKEKRQGGKRIEYSKIWIRNLDEGKNTEAIAGTTPKTLVIDEIGKAPWLEAFAGAIPGFTTPFGWRCVPICVGTGGTFTPNSDAQKVFENPEAYNFLPFEWPGREKKIGLFLPGKYRMEGKVKTTFGAYYRRTSGVLLPEGCELAQLDFYEADEEKARLVTQKELEQYGKADDPKVQLKGRMYYPDQPEDCFLSDAENEFPLQAITEQLLFLSEMEAKGEGLGKPVELYRDVEGKVRFTFTTPKKEILDFPVTQATLKDAPVMLYEPPMEAPPALLYIAGGDPYNQSTSVSSPSLGTVYILKRMYDVVNGTFQNQIVASLASRPGQMREWHKTAEMLLELYNATLMIENAGTNFIEYMDGKNKGFLLADGYNLLQQISPNTRIQNKPKGLPPTPRVINHCMRLLYDYCNEELTTTVDGKQVTKLGVSRIYDRMLLTEMLNYTPEANVDRIVAFRHAIAYDEHLKKIAPVVRVPEDDLIQTKTAAKPISAHSPFRGGAAPFSTRLNRPF